MTANPSEHPAPADHLLGNRNFLLLWGAYAVSALGDHLSEMAILKTQNALGAGVDITPLMARMTFAFFFAFFLFAPMAGGLADRQPRRWMMVGADLVRAALFLVFAGLIAFAQDLGSWGPFLPLLPIGMMAALFSPARSALLSTIVRPGQLVRANAMISGLGIIATMAAAGAGGYLADHYAPSVSFRLDALTYLASAALLAWMRPPRRGEPIPPASQRSAAKQGFVEGIAYVKTHRRVWVLIVISMIVWFSGALVRSVLPAVVRDVYGGTFQTISGYFALLGAGFVVGALTMTAIGDALRPSLAIAIGLVGIASGMLILAASTFLPLSTNTLRTLGAVGVFLGGLFAVITMASYSALLQRIVPNRYRGRVFGVTDVATVGALLLATGLLAVPAWKHLDAWAGHILLGVAVVTGLSGACAWIARLRTSPMALKVTLTYDLNEFITRFWWRFRRIGPATAPRHGPVILTSNHVCPADPNFMGAAVPYRRISFLIAAEYCKWPIVAFLVRTLECIPVKRDGTDTGATKQAIRLLQAGHTLGIFIEGGIAPIGEEPFPKDGVAMLALKTGAQVIPMYISGIVRHDAVLAGLLARHRARLRCGPPVDLSAFRTGRLNRDKIRAATQRIYEAIAALAPDDEDPQPSRASSPADGTTEE
ncbi:MAG: MFS transporter [Phycisphaerae bacterium]